MNDNKDKQKMNFLYVAGFVLAILSMLTAGAAAFVGYYQNKTDLAIIVGGAGALIALVGIILTYCSKTKPKISEKIIDNPENDVL